ncbi:hypothetical protein Plhal304r1_c010g0038461 [Plasmopara halstedii]
MHRQPTLDARQGYNDDRTKPIRVRGKQQMDEADLKLRIRRSPHDIYHAWNFEFDELNAPNNSSLWKKHFVRPPHELLICAIPYMSDISSAKRKKGFVVGARLLSAIIIVNGSSTVFVDSHP